jgi:uncharacterized repeat protein (TIGR01451 family)
MRTHQTVCTLIALLWGLKASALSVNVYGPVPSHCGAASGVLEAQIDGGVPPYSIAWSTGATTAVITGLLPGTYSVVVTDAVGVEASAQGDVMVSSMQQGGQTYVDLAHCPGAYPMAELTLYNQAQWGAYVWGQPPFTITGPSSVMSTSVVPCLNCTGMESLVRVEMDVPPGSLQTIQWQDANGCPGEIIVIMSTEAVWPAVSVYNIQGSCANGSNGSFAWSVTPLSTQRMTLRMYRPNGSLLSSVPLPGNDPSGAHGQLSPGTYMLQVVTEVSGPFGDELCSDVTTVVIEDLGNTCANVNGPVFIDANNSCTWNINENRIPQAIVEFTPGPFYASTFTMGQYSVNLPLGTYDHTVIHPGAQQECPGPFTITAGQATVSRPIGCSSLYPLDAEVSVCNGPARPGFELQYGLNLSNNSVANAGASTLTFTFDPLLTFLSASPAPSSVVGNTITWNLPGIGAYASSDRWIRFQVPPDIGLIGTMLTATANVTTTNTDAAPANNTWTAQQVITAAYDPNDKRARTSTGQSDEVYFIDADEWIDYTIRFQNTGTDTAFTVVITDTLPGTLDPATLNVGAASHAFNWSLSGPGIITFNFPGILLPDSNVNEPLSHGFVGFRIRPRLPVLPGTTITNIANIYFDFNPPIITEPSVLVAEFSTGVHERPSAILQVRPNPTDGNVTVQLDIDAFKGGALRVLASDGRVLLMQRITAPWMELDLAGLGQGIYLIECAAIDGSRATARLVRQ